jgi:hypothetical protein
MAYRNKTYVIFDGDNDMWAYGFMLGWKKNAHMEFDFFNAHDIGVITDRAAEETVKRTLRERLKNTKQAIVVIGNSTKNLYRFVRWEIETCLDLGIPIVSVNLNGARQMDPQLCPPILCGTCTVHVSFNAKIIQKALDDFCENFSSYKDKTDLYYSDAVYKGLGL